MSHFCSEESCQSSAQRFEEVADIIAEALTAQPDTDTSEIATRVTALTEKHPLYPNLS